MIRTTSKDGDAPILSLSTPLFISLSLSLFLSFSLSLFLSFSLSLSLSLSLALFLSVLIPHSLLTPLSPVPSLHPSHSFPLTYSIFISFTFLPISLMYSSLWAVSRPGCPYSADLFLLNVYIRRTDLCNKLIYTKSSLLYIFTKLDKHNKYLQIPLMFA